MATFLLVSLALAQPSPVIDARPGYAARGVILQEGNDTLLLTTTPCAGDADKHLVRFKMPYVKRQTDPIECGNKSYPQFVVRQD